MNKMIETKLNQYIFSYKNTKWIDENIVFKYVGYKNKSLLFDDDEDNII